jgi:lipopolysaccharide/colanic/teichoic acid biosynthesis glycosyltransferase
MSTITKLATRPIDLVGTAHYPVAEARARWSYVVYKRIIDVVLASVLLILATPLMCLIALLIKVTSPGGVIFKQRRLGQSGREFWCYKFRTMIANAEAQLQQRADLRRQFEESYKIKGDPRVTLLGRFLRKTSLDELPQLYNVLRGELSLIGPRAIVPLELAKYGRYGQRLLSVRPGLSGFWQVCGRSDTTYDQRVQMDMFYIANRSVALDLKLIALTAYTILRGRGAY